MSNELKWIGGVILGCVGGAVAVYAHTKHKETNDLITGKVDELYRHVDSVGEVIEKNMVDLNEEAHKCISNTMTYADEAHGKVDELENKLIIRIGDLVKKIEKAG